MRKSSSNYFTVIFATYSSRSNSNLLLQRIDLKQITRYRSLYANFSDFCDNLINSESPGHRLMYPNIDFTVFNESVKIVVSIQSTV